MSAATEGLVRDVVANVPELQPLLAEHLADNYGELLPHVFFGDVTRWALREKAVNSLSLKRLLTLLDASYAKGVPDVQELIAVSFLENLPPGWPAKLGPHLAAARGDTD